MTSKTPPIPLAHMDSESSPRALGSGNESLHDTPPAYPDALREVELRRDLKERHVNMIAFSACVGIGLFLQSGKVIFLAGPGLATLAYLFAGSVMWSVMGSLGEMTALFPIQGGIFVFPARFLDVGIGYAAGWMSWFSWVIIIASEVLAVAHLFDFHFTEDYLVNTAKFTGSDPSLGWKFGQDINPAVWVLLFLVVILLVNFLPVLWYGRLEYLFGCTKMVFIVLLICFNVFVSAIQPVKRDSHGWTYDSPYSFTSQNFTTHGDTKYEHVITGDSGVFLGMWTAITTVVFSMIGFETIAITAAECRDLEETNTIKMGTRKVCLRIILLYALGTLVVSFNVPYTDPNLRNLAITSITPGQNSVFVLAAVLNKIAGFPHFFNAFFIFSATTCGINSLYISSRILHALASVPEIWPDNRVARSIQGRLERTKFGIPYGAVFTSWSFGSLAFLAAGKAPAKQLGRMATNSVVSMLIVYAILCLTYIQFYHCINEAKNSKLMVYPNAGINTGAYNRDNKQTYPYKSRGQWLKAVYGGVGCILLALFNGWQSFVPPFSAPDFIAAYISMPIFVLIVMAYHVKLENTWNPLRWTRLVSRDTRLTNPPPKSKNFATSEQYASGTLKREKRIANWIWAWLK